MYSLKRQTVDVVVLAILLTGFCAFAQETAPRSDTDARIAFYKARLGGRGTYPAYARLGAAYIRKGRETGRQNYYDEAMQYLSTSLDYQRNYEALLWLAVAQLARHYFREALNYAEEAVETMPSHLSAHGALFDSYLALGDLQKAETVVQKMLSLEPGADSYARLATIRQYRGELTGAAEAMQRACSFPDGTSVPVETRAWCEVRLGSLYLLARCEAENAEAAYKRALTLFPNYHGAIEHMAELRAAQGRHDEAITFYQRVLKTTADVTYQVKLANIYDEQGMHQTADRERKPALAELRRLAKKDSRAYLRLLSLVLLDRKDAAAEGLYWARKDWENRHDVLAADTLAWAHHQNGNGAVALETIKEALQSGSKDSNILFHAAVIHAAADERSQARDLLGQALTCPLTLRPIDRHTAETLLANLP